MIEEVKVLNHLDHMQSKSTSARDIWKTLPYENPYPDRLAPGSLIGLFAVLGLAPVIVLTVFLALPKWARRLTGDFGWLLMLIGAAGGVLFLLTFFAYRSLKQWGQLNLNASLAKAQPENFVLYLRSFRRTGAIVVLNHLPNLKDRRLLGNFWDVELALSVSLSEKLPVLAVGAKRSSLGAAKFSTSDRSWQSLVIQLAAQAKAILIVPDDREGTLWELRQILTDPTLRKKSIVVMPPEQYGWLRRLRRLPSVAHSWERTRQALEPNCPLPPYSPSGGFLLADPMDGMRQVDLAHFDPEHVKALVGIAIKNLPSLIFESPETTENSVVEEGWKSVIDPVSPVIMVLVVIAGVFAVEPVLLAISGNDLVLIAIVVGTFASVVVNTSAFTLARGLETNIPVKTDAWWTWSELRRGLGRLVRTSNWIDASAWIGLRSAPGFVRASINALAYSSFVLFASSFLVPFKIPSGSMFPTLLIGDLILVNKFSYGVRLPIVRTKIIDVGNPQRGDVMAFRYPQDLRQDYIKRVVGLPGDMITYEHKRLRINDAEVALAPAGEFYDSDRLTYSRQYSEKLGEIDHKILTELDEPSSISAVNSFPFRDQCNYTGGGVTCTVPPGHYFVMGDNRENSLDSRFWGFVPEANLIGKAFFIWMNFSDFKRIGRI